MIEELLPAGRSAQGVHMVVRVRCSERADGDFRCVAAPAPGLAGARQDHPQRQLTEQSRRLLARRRQALLEGRWTWLNQVHGAGVVNVTTPGAAAGSTADGAATAVPGAVLALHTADCAPVVVAVGGALGVAHVGWRGVVAGVLHEVVAAVRALATQSGGADKEETGSEETDGDKTDREQADGEQADGEQADTEKADTEEMRALLGPVIRPAAYEFGVDELATVAGAVGGDVAAVTSWGAPALDLAAAVKASLRAAGVERMTDTGLDTADERFFSHRLRGEPARMATAARLEPA
ncbi:MAG: polyphenol oxidase family protein [Acidimicrobiaceae bacterium]|nr:polyphenol oxidase family protein [Acidimicrobiaceae bacterium]MCY4279920.1 polyphenol oxidase family protein [Acidimicrobiaceae bacterium]